MVGMIQTTKRVIALALIFWVSGAVCVLKCEMSSMQGDEASTATKQKSSSKMASDHSCCRRAKSNKKIFQIEGTLPTTNNVSCCSYISQPFEHARKIGFQNEVAVATITNNEWLAQPKQNLPSNFSYRPRPPNKSSTHLRNCVFLI
jgi:hypothetical protein